MTPDFVFPAQVTQPAQHDKMVGLVEAMLTADGLQLAAHSLSRMWGQKDAGAVSRKPMVLSDALVYELTCCPDLTPPSVSPTIMPMMEREPSPSLTEA